MTAFFRPTRRRHGFVGVNTVIDGIPVACGHCGQSYHIQTWHGRDGMVDSVSISLID
jgi:hypothetical protein